MKIENVEFHYLANDTIRDIGDGSQDALLVHVIRPQFELLPLIRSWFVKDFPEGFRDAAAAKGFL